MEIVCPACGFGPKSIPIRELIAIYGNVVLPAVLSLVTPSCPRRGKPESLGCSAAFATPLTPAEEVAIKAGRMG